MNPNIKIDLKQRLANGEPIVIELGCGINKKTGRIGVDRLDLPDVDIVCNLEDGLQFLPDSSVDEIYAISILEHIKNFELLLIEITRTLKKEGRCNVFVPHFSNPYYYSDYSHLKFFGLYTFYYFVNDRNQLHRKVPSFYSKSRIHILSKKLVFKSPFKGRNIFKRIIEFTVNSSSWTQEFYEENLCYLIPCYGIKLIFSPDK